MPTKPPLLIPQEMVDPTLLNPHPKNPKLHNDEALDASVGDGLYSPIVVNRGTHTGRPMEILSGHGTREAWMRQHPGAHIQVSLVDVDETRATQILLSANPGGNDPGYIEDNLADLLGTLGASELIATGYDSDFYDDLLVLLEEATHGEPQPIGDKPDLPAPAQGSKNGPGENSIMGDEHSINHWEQQSRRIMLLDLPLRQFVWAQDQLRLLAEKNALPSNAATVLWLITQHTGVPVDGGMGEVVAVRDPESEPDVESL